MRFVRNIFLLFVFSCLLYAQGKDLKNVSVQLQWKSAFEFAGFFVAKQKGYYKDVGLDVSIKEWDNSIDVVDNVLNGKSNYGVTRSSSLIDVSNGKEIVYLCAIYQSTPLVLLANKSFDIQDVRDFKNKRIMLAKEHLQEAPILSIFAMANMSLDDFDVAKHSFDPIDLINGKADLMVAYVSNEPFMLEEYGGDPITFNSKDYGFDFYDDFLFTSKEYLRRNPKEVAAFKQATIKGYKYAFEHIEEVVDLIHKNYNTFKKSKKSLLYEARRLEKLLYYKTDKIGEIKISKLAHMYKTYKALGLIKNDVDLANFLFRYKKSTKLTSKERQYLLDKKDINLCADPNWLPFDKIDSEGNYIGISADYVALFEKFIATNIEPVRTKSWHQSLSFAKQRKCDIIVSATKTQNRKKYLNFTKPYVKFPLVIATKMDVPFVGSIEDLYGKSIGIIKSYAFGEIVRKKYPQIKVVDVKSIEDGFRRVNSGHLFGFIDTLPSIAYNLQLDQFASLKVAGKIYDDYELGIGVRKDDEVLLAIFQKAIDSLTQEQRQKILNKWISIKYETGIDYMLIRKTIIFSLLVLIAIFIWNRKIASKNKLLQKAQEEIKIKNEQLHILATTDKLTGIYNRLKLDDILEHEIPRSKRYKNSFGVCILDIDHFKDVNDTYGHQVGDLTLKDLAQILKHSLRDTDYVGRWGGEEFLIIFLEIDEHVLSSIVEKIRNNIKKHDFDQVCKITCSFGATIYLKDDTLESMLKRADDALYEAKNSGRDKVIIQA